MLGMMPGMTGKYQQMIEVISLLINVISRLGRHGR